MLQQVMTAPGVIQFREVPTPQPQPGEVLVKIMKIGVCGSDIHVYHGEHPFTKYPITQGHEVSGEIAALGSPGSLWARRSPFSPRWCAASAGPAATASTICARS